MLENPPGDINSQIRPHIHRYLRLRLGIYLAVSILVAGFVIYDAFHNTIPGIYAVIGVVIGVGIGFLFSRIHKVRWDEKSSKVIVRVDIYGFFVLILYFTFEIFREKIVGRFVDQSDVTVTSFSILAGLMYGRVLGIKGNILRILKGKDLI